MEAEYEAFADKYLYDGCYYGGREVTDGLKEMQDRARRGDMELTLKDGSAVTLDFVLDGWDRHEQQVLKDVKEEFKLTLSQTMLWPMDNPKEFGVRYAKAATTAQDDTQQPVTKLVKGQKYQDIKTGYIGVYGVDFKECSALEVNHNLQVLYAVRIKGRKQVPDTIQVVTGIEGDLLQLDWGYHIPAGSVDVVAKCLDDEHDKNLYEPYKVYDSNPDWIMTSPFRHQTTLTKPGSNELYRVIYFDKEGATLGTKAGTEYISYKTIYDQYRWLPAHAMKGCKGPTLPVGMRITRLWEAGRWAAYNNGRLDIEKIATNDQLPKAKSVL